MLKRFLAWALTLSLLLTLTGAAHAVAPMVGVIRPTPAPHAGELMRLTQPHIDPARAVCRWCRNPLDEHPPLSAPYTEDTLLDYHMADEACHVFLWRCPWCGSIAQYAVTLCSGEPHTTSPW